MTQVSLPRTTGFLGTLLSSLWGPVTGGRSSGGGGVWLCVCVCVWFISPCGLQPGELRSFGEEEVLVDKWRGEGHTMGEEEFP